MKPIPQLFKYPGSKVTVMKKLLPYLPKHHHYISVFGGSAADILGKPPSKLETYNDLDGNLTNVFRILKHPSQRSLLCLLVEDTLPSRLEFVDAIRVLSDDDDPVWRAWAYLVIAINCFAANGAGAATPSSFVYIVKPSCGIRRWATPPQRITEVAARFRYVQAVENLPWEEVFDRYDSPESCFYCDPPYVLETRVAKSIYRYEMTYADHERFLRRVQTLEGHVIISGYDCQLYNRYLRKWKRLEFPQKCSISWRAKKPPRVEVVWINRK